MDRSSLGNRMKHNYEQAYSFRLPLRMPTIIRLDGKAFHTFTRGFARPFDLSFMQAMATVTEYLCRSVQTAVFGYTQSDEISLLLHPYQRLDSQPWFDNEIQKIVSVSASMASSILSRIYGREALFDARVFVLPEAEVVNYFIWRQQDASRNSLNMLAQSIYSHRQLQGRKSPDIHDMLMNRSINWNDLPTYQKRGTCLVPGEETWIVDQDCPIFSQDRQYIERLLTVCES